jgi:Mg2+ and Co2+ transporter CorA
MFQEVDIMNKLICQRHDDIIKTLKTIRNEIQKSLKYDRDNAEVLVDLLDDIDTDLYNCIDEIEEAKDSGEKMENRLTLYRNTIEDLGFERKK